MILHNPTNNKLGIIYEGKEYSIDANGVRDIPEKIALYWKNKIHNFLEIKEIIEIPEEVIVTRESMVAELGEEEVKKIEDESEPIDAIAVIKKSVKKKTK